MFPAMLWNIKSILHVPSRLDSALILLISCHPRLKSLHALPDVLMRSTSDHYSAMTKIDQSKFRKWGRPCQPHSSTPSVVAWGSWTHLIVLTSFCRPWCGQKDMVHKTTVEPKTWYLFHENRTLTEDFDLTRFPSSAPLLCDTSKLNQLLFFFSFPTFSASLHYVCVHHPAPAKLVRALPVTPTLSSFEHDFLPGRK